MTVTAHFVSAGRIWKSTWYNNFKETLKECCVTVMGVGGRRRIRFGCGCSRDSGMSSAGGISTKHEAGTDDGTAKQIRRKKMQQPQLTLAPVQLVLCTSPQAAIPTPESQEVWRWRHSECNLSSLFCARPHRLPSKHLNLRKSGGGVTQSAICLAA